MCEVQLYMWEITHSQDNNSHLLKDSESERPIFESAGIPFVLLIDPPSEVVLHRKAEESPLQGWPVTLSLRPSFCLLIFELLGFSVILARWKSGRMGIALW